MKWFKHLSHSLDDQFICELMDEFGSDGYLTFFGILEILADEFDVEKPGEVTLSWRYLRRKLRLSTQKLKKILKYCEDSRIFIVNNKERSVTIKSIKFSDICDEYTQRLLKKEAQKSIGILSGQYRDNVRVEVEEEKEREKEEETPKKESYRLPTKEEVQESSIPKIKEDLDKICEYLYETKKFPKVHIFKNKMLKEGKYERAILHTLIRCALKDDFEDTPWGYCIKIIEVENGNYNEYEYGKDKD